MNERILAGRYCLQDAVGGRTDLFHAIDESLQRKVAVKRLAGTRPGVNRVHWEQEIAKAAGLHDPHLLAIYDVVVEEDCFYLITEDIEGDILTRWMRRRAPLTPEMAIDILFQLTGAVVQAERNGLRDILIDANSVLVTREGFVKVIEYGPLLGSNHKGQTHAVLLRTAGALLFEMLTGTAYSDFLPTREVVEEVQRAMTHVAGEQRWLPDRMEQMVARSLGLLEGRTYLSVQDLYKELKTVHQALDQQSQTAVPAKEEAAAVAEIPAKLERVKESVLDAAKVGLKKAAQLKNMERVTKLTEQNRTKPKQKRTPLTALWAVLAVVVVAGGLWYMLGDEKSNAQSNVTVNAGKTVSMPNLINKTNEQAMQLLAAQGIPNDQILWVYRPADDPNTPQGKIYSQSVNPKGSVVVGGSKIILTVNGDDSTTATASTDPSQQGTDGSDSGSGTGSNNGSTPGQTNVAQGTVPNLRGMSADQAGAMLIQQGYHYRFSVASGGDTPSGTVFKQVPDAGTSLASGQYVQFYVSQ